MAIKDARKILILKHRKGRESEQKYQIEGIRLCEEALLSNAPVDQLVFCRQDLEENARLLNLFQEAGRRRIRVQQTDRRAMKGICDTQSPQGVMGVVKMPRPNRNRALESSSPLLLLDRIRDPGNLGLILRTAEAAGAGAVFIFKGSVELFNPKVVRASMGSIFRLPAFRNEDPVTLLTFLRNQGVSILSTQIKGIPFYKFQGTKRFALLLGNEAFGIDPTLTPLVDDIVSIPMAEPVNSLNVAVAAGILLYKFQEICHS